MIFIKNLLFDIKNGFCKKYTLFFLSIMISASIFFCGINEIHRCQALPMINIGSASFGDLLFYLYGGMKEYIPSPENPFRFPALWIILFITISFLVLNYPVKDMMGIGSQILVRSKGRSKWWLSKCFWNILCTITYHLIIWAVMAGFCILHSIPLNLHINTRLQCMIFELNLEDGLIQQTVIPISVLLLPICISVGLNLLQMTLSLFMKTVYSFLTVAIILLSSAYLITPFFPGNFAMTLRSDWIMDGGVSSQSGYIVALLLILVSITVGLIRFMRYDILNKEDN